MLSTKTARNVVRTIHEIEEQLREAFGTEVIETRLLPYPPKGSMTKALMKERIHQLCDFALFQGQESALALVETGLRSPFDSVDVESSVFEVVANPKNIQHMESELIALWQQDCTLLAHYLSDKRLLRIH